MNITEIVTRLAEIKIQKMELQKQEDQLLATLKYVPSNLNGGGIARPVGRPKGSKNLKKARFSWYSRQKMSRTHKQVWANKTQEEQKEIIARRLAGRKKSK